MGSRETILRLIVSFQTCADRAQTVLIPCTAPSPLGPLLLFMLLPTRTWYKVQKAGSAPSSDRSRVHQDAQVTQLPPSGRHGVPFLEAPLQSSIALVHRQREQKTARTADAQTPQQRLQRHLPQLHQEHDTACTTGSAQTMAVEIGKRLVVTVRLDWSCHRPEDQGLSRCLRAPLPPTRLDLSTVSRVSPSGPRSRLLSPGKSREACSPVAPAFDLSFSHMSNAPFRIPTSSR